MNPMRKTDDTIGKEQEFDIQGPKAGQPILSVQCPIVSCLLFRLPSALISPRKTRSPFRPTMAQARRRGQVRRWVRLSSCRPYRSEPLSPPATSLCVRKSHQGL